MTEPSHPDLDVEQLIQRVREEAARRQQDAASPSTAPTPRQWLYSLGDLLRHDDVEFVTQIYQCVLQREPDPDGLRDHLSRLRNGECSKIDLLRNLRFSPEGERVGVEVQGLLPPAESLTAPTLDPPAELPIQDRYTFGELLQYRDAAFVRNAYRALLHREPDEVGLAHHLEKLRSGVWTRLDIIQGLRSGPEGQAAAVELIGWKDALLSSPPSLPPGNRNALTLAEWLELPDEAFVAQAYRTLLRREPDEAGQRHHLERLRAGQSTRIDVLGQLRYSREGRQAGVAVPGLGWPFVLQTAYRLPIIGDVLALAALILRPRSWITRLRRLEARDDQFRVQEARVADLSALLEQIQVERAAQWARFQQLADLQVGMMELDQVKRGVRDLADRLAAELTQVKWLADAKANGVECLEQSKASAIMLAQMRQALASKAEAVELAQAWQALEGKAEAVELAQAWQALEGKAEAAHLTPVWQALAGKVETTDAQEELKALQERIEGELNPMRQQLYDYRRNLTDQQRRLGLLLEEARKRLPAPLDEQQLSILAREQDHLMDALYVSFEDQFRGTRTEIQQRLQVYLPHLRKAGAGLSENPILDIGCGRGEWLELLTQEGFVARGIDLNRTMVAGCRERGLRVDEAEALACLCALPDASLGAVTGLHIIEHLPLAILIGVLDEALRVVRPGGVVIFETPNPENLMVSAYNFYFDPTHRNPLPPLLSSFLLEGRGWTPVEILRLNPYPEHQRFSVDGGQSQVTSWLNEVFCGPQDYAVIGHKP